MSAHERAIEATEIVNILRSAHVPKLIKALTNEPKCFTANGRINCAATARYLRMTPADVGAMLAKARETRLY